MCLYLFYEKYNYYYLHYSNKIMEKKIADIQLTLFIK